MKRYNVKYAYRIETTTQLWPKPNTPVKYWPKGSINVLADNKADARKKAKRDRPKSYKGIKILKITELPVGR